MKFNWSEPKEIISLNKYVKTTIIEEQDIDDFFNIWKSEKNDEIKNSGFSIKKYNEKWQFNYWSNDKNTDDINKECERLCIKYGFFDNKKEVINEKIEEIINILDNLDDKFEKYNCLDLLNEIKSDILLKLNDIKTINL